MDDILSFLLEGILRICEVFSDALTTRQSAIVIFSAISFVAVIGGCWFDGGLSLFFFVIAATTMLLTLAAWWRLIGQ